MIQLIGLRALGVCLAAVLAFHAGLRFCGDVVRPEFRASDLFRGHAPPAGPGSAAAGFAALVSFDGELLANTAAVKAAEVLHHQSGDARARAETNKAAEDAVVGALKVSPIRPALWLTLGMLRVASNEPLTPALKMSYLTGSVPEDVAFARVQTVTSTSAAADEEVRLLAQSDIRNVLANRARFEAPVTATYVRATAEGKSLLLDATRAIDPAFNARLRSQR